MRTRKQATIRDLRLAIDCLPRPTREAMLQGISGNEIIVGAYTDGDGICPMLAAHRAGGRTNLISFAKAWDRFAFRGTRVRVARRATERELLILRTHLEASLLNDEGPAPDLAEAMAEHRELVANREQRFASRRSDDADRAHTRRAEPHSEQLVVRPGDPDRSRELRTRHGWAWMRVFRRYDDYERALLRLEHERRMAEDERDDEPDSAGRGHGRERPAREPV
jgi:hypothetical protein